MTPSGTDVRFGSFSEVGACLGVVRFTPANGHHRLANPGPKSANNGRSFARCDRLAMVAASIRIYALVARGHRLRRDGRRRKRCEIRVLVVADPYAGIGDEPISGGDRVARA